MVNIKNRPELRFGGFEGDWDLNSIASSEIKVVDGDRGVEYPKSSDFEPSGYCLFLNAKNVTKNGFRFEEMQFISEEKHNKLRKGLVKRGSLILTTRGSIGHFSYYDQSIPYDVVRINSGMVVLENDDETISSDFFNIVCKSPIIKKQIAIASFGSAQPQLTVGLINKFKFCVPSLPEQQKIAAFLGAVDAKLTALRRKRDLLQEYKRGMMQKIFSRELRFKGDDGVDFPDWVERRLGEVCSHFKSGENITSEDISGRGAYPVYGGNGLRGYADGFTHDGTYILIGRQGALCGNIKRTNGKTYISEHAIVVDANEENNLEWLFQKLDLMKLNRLSESSAQPGLSAKKLQRIKFNVPVKEEQQLIADFLSTLDSKIEAVVGQIVQVETFLKGLLQKMFV